MASLRTTLPHILHALPKAAAPQLRSKLAFSLSTTSRFLSTNSRSFLSNQALPKRFPSATLANTTGTRAISSGSVSQSGSSTQAPVDWTKIATNIGIAAVAAVGLNYALNRETRGALSLAESSYLNETFMWTGAGLLITGSVAKLLHSNGVAARLMSLNPWLFMGVGLAASIGSMMGVFYTEPGTVAHTASWAAFSALQGVTLSPMFFLNPAILSRAALYTAGALGGLTYVGCTAQSEQFLYIGGFLMAGLGVVILTSLAPMLLPRMAGRTMSVLEHVSAYGGVALFSGFILYDTQKVLKHAKMVEMGALARDPIRESVSLILDAINLFVRIVQVLMLQQRKK